MADCCRLPTNLAYGVPLWEFFIGREVARPVLPADDRTELRATISPSNQASPATIAGFGFVENGEQWDEEDGVRSTRICSHAVPTPN